MASRARVITTFINQVQPTDQSAAFKIFNQTWQAAVPHMYLYTEEYMRINGQVISDPTYDARLPREMIGGLFTIAQLATLMEEGAQIRIDDPEDTKRIYDIVSRHLEDWSDMLTKGSAFDLKRAPTEDLMQLSRLADTLYGYASRYFTQERPRGSLQRRFDQIRGRHKLGSGRQYVDKNAPLTPEQKQTMPGHSEFTENILTKGSGRNSWS